MHLPAMLREVVDALELREGGTYIDATLGMGGHAEEILKHIGPGGTLIGIDRDPEALKRAMERIKDIRLKAAKAKFSEIEKVARENGVEGADGVLFDFGVSLLQLKGPERGFSFLSAEPLDMRMDPTEPLTAEKVVNEYPEKEIEKIVREYGEEKKARRVARSIATERRKGRIRTCKDLSEIVTRAVGGRRGKIHPATRTFQALRIAVNDELGEIKRGLDGAMKILGSKGRLVTIAYHSLEDRIAKTSLKEASNEGKMKLITKKPIRPSREETRDNPSARSARLRVGEAL